MWGKLLPRICGGALALCLTVGLWSSLPAARADETGIAGKDDVISTANGLAFVYANGELWAADKDDKSVQQDGLSSPLIKVMDDVASVSAGAGYTAVIKNDRSLWMWGYNDRCQLGFRGGDTTTDRGPAQSVPVKVMDDVAAVACGGWHTAAIKTDGSLWLWGANNYGAIGNGQGGYVRSGDDPLIVETPMKIMDNVSAVSCGGYWTAAVKTDGSLWMWGMNTAGELGTNFAHTDSSTSHLWQATPVKVMDGVASVSCGGSGSYSTVILKTDGSVWVCGSYEYRKTGTEWTLAPGYYLRGQPVPVKIMDGARAIFSRYNMAAAIKTDGTLWTWGTYYLGNGTRYSSFEPVLVAENVADFSNGNTVFLKNDGSTWIWGNYYDVPGGIDSHLSPVLYAAYEDLPLKLPAGVVPSQPEQKPEPAPVSGVAYAADLTVNIDGKPVQLQAFALKDAAGGSTNYLKLRDVALVLNGSAAQFQVGWDGMVSLTAGQPYTPNGSELTSPFTGDQPYSRAGAATHLNGVEVPLEAIVLTAPDGSGYTYYKLRDLGEALGFSVGWSAERGVFVETDKPYSGG